MDVDVVVAEVVTNQVKVGVQAVGASHTVVLENLLFHEHENVNVSASGSPSN